MNVRRIRVVTAVVEQEGRYLITQRRETAVLPLLWEFPGGKVEAGEADPDAPARGLAGRLRAQNRGGGEGGGGPHGHDRYTPGAPPYPAGLPPSRLPPKPLPI